MLELGWDKKPNVRILFGRWQDVVDDLTQYDGIFFDTYAGMTTSSSMYNRQTWPPVCALSAEHYKHMRSFHALLPNILKQGGIYSFFNGLAPRSAFFQRVYRHVVESELARDGFDTQYLELPVDVENKCWDKVWADVKTRYFFADSYHLPVVYWKDQDDGHC